MSQFVERLAELRAGPTAELVQLRANCRNSRVCTGKLVCNSLLPPPQEPLGNPPSRLDSIRKFAKWGLSRRNPVGQHVLNLFGYTGVGTLLLSEAEARMVHVDASKKSVEQGQANAALSGLADRPIRWLVDDATKFTAREVRRGRRYDGILLDPPKFGRGPEGEVWRLEENLAPLLADCRKLLDEKSRFLVLTVYAVRMSAASRSMTLAPHCSASIRAATTLPISQ